MPTRRSFFNLGLTAGAFAFAVDARTVPQSAKSRLPWYRRAYRWGQTNITEKDPVRYDIPWWREFWKKTNVQAVIINAGGIVAYYPSKYSLHHRAEFLNGRDLFGELTKAAHDEGLFVMARIDQTERLKTSSRHTLTGSHTTSRASRSGPRISTWRASTVHITKSIFPAFSGRSSSARGRTALRTTAGPVSVARVSATARTAPGDSAREGRIGIADRGELD
jgi:hypothetical protein